VTRRATALSYLLSATASLRYAAGLLPTTNLPPRRAAVVFVTLSLVAAPPFATALWWRRQASRSTQRLHQLAPRWELVQRGGEDRIVELDPDGTLTRVGPAAAALLGTQPRHLSGKNLLGLVHPDERDRMRRLLRRSVEGKIGWDSDSVGLLRGDGTSVNVNSAAVVRLDRARRVTGFTAALRPLRDEAVQAGRALVRERIVAVLAERALTIVVQPIFSLDSGRVVGVEALSRFAAQPSRGPDRWFADAHEAGLGVALEVLAVQTALHQAVTLPGDYYVSVNVSPATLSSPALRDAVAAGPIAADRIVLELTEHICVDDYGTLIDTVAELRAQGLRLAIDDAGAGFASFRHILRLRPDVIKLDRAITRGIDAEPAHRALAAALVMFVLEVGSTTIVTEGVETQGELRAVAALGIDAAQGYLVGRPAAANTRWTPIDGLIDSRG
jgi:PAS domain S-box-containing protein